MRFRFPARHFLPVLLLLSAGCEKDGETFTVRTRLLSPADVADPLAGLDRVRIRVIQDGDVRGEKEFAPDAAWKIPSGADPGDELVVRIDGLDAGGAVLMTGATRPLVPDESKDRTFGIFFSVPGEFAQPPSPTSSARVDADLLALPDGRVVAVGGGDGAGLPVTTVTLYDPDEGTWTDLAPLGEARLVPGVAVLPDGLTLFVAGGGDGAGASIDSTELYRVPARGADAEDLGDTTPGPPLVTAWEGMFTAALPSGKIVLGGGFSDGTPLPLVYDPAGGSLYELTGGVFAEGGFVTATGDGRVAIVGGSGAESRVDVISEDSTGNVILTTGVGVLRVPRSNASAVSIGPGRLMVAGGDGPGGRTAAIEIVDLVDGARSAIVERERVHRSARPTELLGDGRILLAGGNAPGGADDDAFVFDPATNLAEPVPDLLIPAQGRRYTAPMPDGTAMLFGGDDTTGVWIFQPPVDPLAGPNRSTFTVTLTEGSRAAGAVLDGASALRVRVFDSSSEVLDVSSAPGTSVAIPNFLADDNAYVVVQAEDGAGSVLAWGATAAPIDQTAQASGALTVQMGRVGEFVLAPNPLPHTHTDGAIAQLADGRVVVAAGLAGTAFTDAYDPGTGAVADLNAAVPTPRRDVRSVLLPGGLFLVGGRNDMNAPVRAASLFDLATATWTSLTPIPAPGRHFHAVVSLGDGTMLSHGNNVQDAAVIAPEGDIWDGMNWIPTNVTEKRSRHRGALLGDGTVLLAAGLTSAGTLAISATAVTFDPGTLDYTPTGNLATARRDHVAFSIPGGDAVVCGGLSDIPNSPPVATCERYNRMTRTFAPAGSLSVARDDSGCVSLPDGTTWIVGGSQGNVDGPTPAVDIWDGAIAPGPTLRAARGATHAVALRDGRVVVAGGNDEAGAPTATVEIHTPAAWTNPFGY